MLSSSVELVRIETPGVEVAESEARVERQAMRNSELARAAVEAVLKEFGASIGTTFACASARVSLTSSTECRQAMLVEAAEASEVVRLVRDRYETCLRSLRASCARNETRPALNGMERAVIKMNRAAFDLGQANARICFGPQTDAPWVIEPVPPSELLVVEEAKVVEAIIPSALVLGASLTDEFEIDLFSQSEPVRVPTLLTLAGAVPKLHALLSLREVHSIIQGISTVSCKAVSTNSSTHECCGDLTISGGRLNGP